MERSIYNLEFRPKSHQMVIGDYSFDRVTDYLEQHGKLHHSVNSHGWETQTQVQTGGHAQTATVVGPDTEHSAAIQWPNRSSTALDDIILLLTLFTTRHVFAYEPTNENPEPIAIIADPRQFPWGGVLACSLPFERGGSGDADEERDATLEIHLPQIYDRIRDQVWLDTYSGGYFLVLLSEAIKQRSLESAFTQCWTIWEHLFAVLNDNWISNQSLRRLAAKEKICNLLVHFGVKTSLSDAEKSRIRALVDIRNRLIHFGQFPEQTDVRRDAMMFIRMTEFLGAKSLGLLPSNVFNTIERFEEFLSNATNRGT